MKEKKNYQQLYLIYQVYQKTYDMLSFADLQFPEIEDEKGEKLE